MNEEGWYLDPYGRHEARWISVGAPTALVRDGTLEAQDPPPDQPMAVELVPWTTGHAPDASDLKRADDEEAGDVGPKSPIQAAVDAIDQIPNIS